MRTAYMPTLNIGTIPPAGYDPELDLHQSPLWPLHQDLRIALSQVTDPDDMASIQNTVVTIKTTFASWRTAPSLTFLRQIIRSLIEQTDVSDDTELSAFKSQVLSSSHWSDVLPS